ADWQRLLRYDPITPLLNSPNPAVVYFTRWDLCDEPVGPVTQLWTLPPVGKLLRRQADNGAWPYKGPDTTIRSQEDYDQIETFRALGLLVTKYGLTREHDAIRRGAEFLFSRQHVDGDFRGIYGRQTTPNYTGAILAQLIHAGYGDDPRVARAFDWLLAMRQDAGGWALPFQTRGMRLDRATLHAPPAEPDRTQPNSQLATDAALRAFAAYPAYRTHEAAQHAGACLADRLFKRGEYPGRQDEDYWFKFHYPFWFTDLLSALDTLTILGFTPEHRAIEDALDWFIMQQRPDGQWDLKLLAAGGDKEQPRWLALAICRVLKRTWCAG
ncbi:MAG: adenosine deaminase, partial [Anaerolineae bacterium]|nr:adenosine deaminase [Anaerolineae bacterium]